VASRVKQDARGISHAENERVQKVRKAFVETYGGPEDDIHVFFTPGRVNLMGDHTDYNGGFVLPTTISLGIYAAVRYTASPGDPRRVFRARSLDAQGELWLELSGAGEDGEELPTVPPGSRKERPNGRARGWTAYPEGVARYLMREGIPVPGCDVLYVSDLPVGAGLSSSAALELVTAYVLLSGREVDRVWLAKLCRRVENEFVGVRCGIMDQFAVAMGKRGYAILLDCGALEAPCWEHGEMPAWRHVSLNTGGYSFVIMDSRKGRSLASSAYNERREACDVALRLIRKHKDIANLCRATLDDILRYVDDPVLQRRARHVVTENLRTKEAAKLLEQGKGLEFGALMVESHRSLRDDYEVTGPELDALVEAALETEGCIGARMTGAGFGGCALALVRADCLESFKERVEEVYRQRTGLSPAFYPCQSFQCEGTRR